MRINVEVIPHSKQRYDTTGDWWFDFSNEAEPLLQVRVSKMSDWRYEMLVAHHEITEALLCYNNDITDKEVTQFDEAFEKARKQVGNLGEDSNRFKFHDKEVPSNMEPGDHPEAPYYHEHQIATGFERILAAEFDVVWGLYEEDCQSAGS